MNAIEGTAAQWKYTGDVNIEYGGTFYSVSDIQWGYCNAVRVQPLSDAGGPDNQYSIERITINIPETRKSTEECIQEPKLLAIFDSIETPADVRQAILIESALSYGHYEIDSTENIQVGKRCEYTGHKDGHSHIDKFLRESCDLANYVKSNFLN